MENTTTVVLKSKKIPQKNKKRVVWIIAIILFVITLVSFISDYSAYKEGQKFGLASATISSELSGLRWIDKNDSYAEQCEAAYKKLNSHTPDYSFDGYKYDGSEVRKSENELRKSFAGVMKAGGYDRYDSYNIMNWFKYTNPIAYFNGCFATHPLSILLYLYLLFAIIFTLSVNKEEKKELIVYEDSVLCKLNSKNSKQIVFEDISNIELGKNSLKLAGVGVEFKISNITNAEEIKTSIIDRKKTTKKKALETAATNVSNADELKKYKELLDTGVISQKEFDAKKKQLLGM